MLDFPVSMDGYSFATTPDDPIMLHMNRAVAGISVNRWPHGYAWTPNPIFNGEFEDGEAPNEIGRKPFGNIHIANSDAGARAYLDCAIDEAYRAVNEIQT